LGISLVLFFASIALVGMGYIGSDFFPGNDKGEVLGQLELEKDASLETTNAATQRAEHYISTKPDVDAVITPAAQSSDGGFSSVSGSRYKSEIHVVLDQSLVGTINSKVYSAQLKRELEKELVGAKVRVVNMGLMGAEQAPIKLTVIGSSLEDAREF